MPPKAELRACPHNGWMVDDAPCPELAIGESRPVAVAMSSLGGATGMPAFFLVEPVKRRSFAEVPRIPSSAWATIGA